MFLPGSSLNVCWVRTFGLGQGCWIWSMNPNTHYSAVATTPAFGCMTLEQINGKIKWIFTHNIVNRCHWRISRSAYYAAWTLASDLYGSFCLASVCVAHLGGVEVAGWTVDWANGFDSWHALTVCGPSDGEDVKDVLDVLVPVSG